MRDIWSGIPKEIALIRKKKYIFGTTISSFSVFLMSLNENIYIEGFIFNNDNLLERPFNKEVIQIENIPEDSIILVPDDLMDSFKTFPLKNCCEIHKVYVHRLSEQIREKEIYIWGTGNNGFKTFRLLTENNVRIKGFIDSDIRKKGKIINGLLVYAPESIEQ
uniref:nucleoside-diphosphate sugar epimerase/dehydratase n=1 Tax=Parablautia intestinalis TaxID=2320100 RepID=UPI002ED15650